MSIMSLRRGDLSSYHFRLKRWDELLLIFSSFVYAAEITAISPVFFSSIEVIRNCQYT